MLIGCQPGTGENSPNSPAGMLPPQLSGDLLTQIQDSIFTPVCSECHIGSQAPLGLRLENTDVSYQFLVNVAAVGNSSFQRVLPDEPDNSFLVLKIEGDPRAGQRMPLGRTTPLSDENIQLIKSWIERGALPAESSQVLTKIVAVKNISQQNNSLKNNSIFVINFSQLLNEETVIKDNILIFQNIEGQKFLLSQNSYEIELVDQQNIQLTIINQRLQNKSLSLVINHPSTSGIQDIKGRLLDGDNDQLEGGVYETKL